ncbi:MAG: enoyl-CoA hydratase [Bacteroidia bacterium]|nr:enoyl-CoA hydratase [Bacteroidia bacterium]
MEKVQLVNNEVLFEQGDGICVITINRPSAYNGITTNVKLGLLDALKKANRNEDIKAVVLTGAGKGFSAGADLREMLGEITPLDVKDDLNTRYNLIIKLITELHKPVIAAINGTFAGAAIGFASACDVRYMAENAKMRYAFINIGLIPDAGSSWFLTRAVGYTKAFEIISGGEKISADECLKLGIVNKLLPQEEVLSEAIRLAKKIAEGPTKAYGHTKKLLQFAVNNTLSDTMAKEAELQSELIFGHDNREGVQAFLEKRKPKFIGK